MSIKKQSAQAVGHAARERVRKRFLPPHFLGGHLGVIDRILSEAVRRACATRIA